MSKVGPGGWLGGVIALAAIYLPAFLLVVGTLPFWERLRASRHCQAALKGANAAVVGLLVSALYDPAWTGAIHSSKDFGLALAGLPCSRSGGCRRGSSSSSAHSRES